MGATGTRCSPAVFPPAPASSRASFRYLGAAHRAAARDSLSNEPVVYIDTTMLRRFTPAGSALDGPD